VSQFFFFLRLLLLLPFFHLQVIGAVASIDLPAKQWVGPTGLIAQILQCVTAPAVPEHAKEAALEACG
jgi:hypothetical protein